MDSLKQQHHSKGESAEEGIRFSPRADELIKRVEELDEELQQKFTREAAILFTDIKGSTIYFKTHGDIAGRLMMQRHYDMLSPIITHYEGIIVKTVGDSIMASFGTPSHAVNAAIDMQRTLWKHNARLPEDDHIKIRIGINFGKVITENDDIYGNVVNEASKLVSIGESEQILVSASVYHSLHSEADALFSPFEPEHSSEDVVSFPIYVVQWQRDFLSEREMTTLSLSLVNQTPLAHDDSSVRTHYFSPIEHLIKEKVFRVTVNPEGRLSAIFEDAKRAVEVALEILKVLQKSDQLFHIGIHTGTLTVTEDELYGGEEADEACAHAEINEIYITHPTFVLIKDSPLLKSISLPDTLKNGTALYKILWEPTEKRRVEEPSLITRQLSNPECFYCSSRNHHISLCPSKGIPFHTHSLNEMGYLSPAEIKALFATYFPTIVSPHKPDQDEILTPLIPDQKPDSPNLPFESFYEVTEIFQLRFLREVWRSEATDWNQFVISTTNRRGGGFLWLGEDCLRVSKYDEAHTMFTKAVEHNADDYRPYLALGVLTVETDNLTKATTLFRRALLHAHTPLHKSYILLLLARIDECKGNLADALERVREASYLAPHFLEVKYRHAVLLAKNDEKYEALSIFKNLIATEPTFYIRVLIDPGLNIIRGEIDLLTKELYEQAKVQASNNIKTIRKSLIDHGEWFSKQDPEYQAAEKIFNQTLKLFEGNSYFGLLDVVGYGFNIKDKLRAVLKNKRKSIRKNLNSFYAIWEDYHLYLERYCYKDLLSYGDLFLENHFITTMEKARVTISIDSAESLKNTHHLINELTALSKKITNNRKKLNFLKMIYFTLECSAKFFSRLLLSCVLVSTIFCVVLIGYHGYSQSLYHLSSNLIIDYLKFSSCCGGIFGAGVSVYWIYKNFDHLYEKLK